MVPVVALLVRSNDIKVARMLTSERMVFILFGIFVEYIWWCSTLAGYIRGRSMSNESIAKDLKGR